MNKFKISLTKIRKYLREVSVVVIGVAVTLFASYWIGVENEKRNMILHLNAIKVEQEENIKILESAIEHLEPSVKYTLYLWSHDKNSLNKDSIHSYFSVANNFESFTFKTNAFEMFKNSGVMRLMKNKELLLAIWDVYAELLHLKQTGDEYNNRKWSLIEKDIPLIEINKGEVKYDIIPMYSFYAIGAPIAILLEYEQALEKSKTIVMKLKKMYPCSLK